MGPLVAGCLSCDVVSGKRTEPGGVIYEDDHWHVGSIMPPVVWQGFLIVKLKRHCEHVAKLTSEEAATLGPVITATSAAVREVLKPAKVYVCSFGDGVKNIHFWILPRPPEMRSGMHAVMLNLDTRMALTRLLGIKRWVCSDEEIAETANRLREQFQRPLAEI
jgi:diadenosine tetraphosphate (Ap4A) HIT family hydrolase